MTFATRDEVRGRVDAVRGALEAWLLTIDERRSMSEARAAEGVRRASAALAGFSQSEVIDERAVAALDAAREALEAARARLDAGAAAPLDEALGEMETARRACLDLLSPVAPAPAAAVPFLASLGEPALHGGIQVPDPQVVARDDDFVAGLDADEVQAPAFPPASTEPTDPAAVRVLAQLRALGRDCLEDVGIMGSLRMLWDHEPWVDAEGFELRLLQSMDALVALERPLDPAAPRLGLVSELWRYAVEWTVPDRGRSFALAFLLACLDSPIATVWISLALRRARPEVTEAFRDALALGSSPHVDRLLEELLLDDDPLVLRTALQACARRRPVSAWSATLVAHPREDVALAALACAAQQPHEEAVATLEPLLDDGRALIAASAAAALVELGKVAAASSLRALLDPGSALDPAALTPAIVEVAASTLAVLGVEADVELLGAAAVRHPELAPWLGWHGYPRHVPTLLDAAEAASGTLASHQAADALERLTGLPFEETLVLDARSVTTVLDVARYRARLKEHLTEAPLPSGRARRGRPFASGMVLDELEHPSALQGARRILARELRIVTASKASIDVEGWNVTQRARLAEIRASWRSAR